MCGRSSQWRIFLMARPDNLWSRVNFPVEKELDQTSSLSLTIASSHLFSFSFSFFIQIQLENLGFLKLNWKIGIFHVAKSGAKLWIALIFEPRSHQPSQRLTAEYITITVHTLLSVLTSSVFRVFEVTGALYLAWLPSIAHFHLVNLKKKLIPHRLN